MKRIFSLILVFLLCSCLSKKADDPLIVPPNFSEMPDLNNPELPSSQQKEENIAKLKELLLKSDE
jgi:hypothetical protein